MWDWLGDFFSGAGDYASDYGDYYDYGDFGGYDYSPSYDYGYDNYDYGGYDNYDYGGYDNYDYGGYDNYDYGDYGYDNYDYGDYGYDPYTSGDYYDLSSYEPSDYSYDYDPYTGTYQSASGATYFNPDDYYNPSYDQGGEYTPTAYDQGGDYYTTGYSQPNQPYTWSDIQEPQYTPEEQFAQSQVAENTIPVDLGGGQQGHYDPNSGTVYNANGSVNWEQSQQQMMSQYGFGPQYASLNTGTMTDAGPQGGSTDIEVTGGAYSAENPLPEGVNIPEGYRLGTYNESTADIGQIVPVDNGNTAFVVPTTPAGPDVAPGEPGSGLSQGGYGAALFGENPYATSSSGVQGGPSTGGKTSPGMFDAIGGWIKENPKMATALGLGGVAGLVGLGTSLFGGSSAAAAPAVAAGGAPAAGGAINTATGTVMPGSVGGTTQTPLTGATPQMPGAPTGTTPTGTTPTGTTPTGTTPTGTTPTGTTPTGTTPTGTTPTGTTPTGTTPTNYDPLLYGLGGLLAGYLGAQGGQASDVSTAPASGNYYDQFGAIKDYSGAGTAGIFSSGLNPGWIPSAIQPANPNVPTTQNQYNWGAHPYMGQLTDLPYYNAPMSMSSMPMPAVPGAAAANQQLAAALNPQKQI